MFERRSYDGHDFSGAAGAEGQYEGLEFHDCQLEGANFTEAVFRNCSFEKCRFSGAKFNGAQFIHCAIVNCTFQYASLFGASFEECKMTGTVFVGSDASALTIRGGDWSYTDLREMDFYKMDLEGENITKLVNQSVLYINFDNEFLYYT